MTKYNLVEYGLAKQALEEMPKIKNVLDKSYTELYKYREYLCVQHTLDSISDSLKLLDRQYKEFKRIVEKKGKE